ncbi:response regulator [Actinoplanes sp. NPDC026670]|uniref:response regulator n=1 Tax=Actinoplanes sp. NPDC026670 TaxID=3154700 RepID=UPI0033C2ECA5
MVLVVEDDQDNRQMVVHILERYGLAAMSAPEPAEALLACEAYSEPIDLLLTDIALPGVSGGALARSVAVLRPDVRVLYMTAMPRDIAVRRAQLRPDANILTKPFTADQLTTMIKTVLAGPDSPQS